MGSINRFDENFFRFRVGLRGKKWWFPLFAFGIDAMCQNAWHLMKNSDAAKDFTYVNFKE